MDKGMAGELNKSERSKYMLAYLAMGSIVMFFAGLCSAFLLRRSAPDWTPITLPSAFYISTTIIIISSILLFLGQKSLKYGNLQSTSKFLKYTIFCGIAFLIIQIYGWYQMYESNHFFAGPGSHVSYSFVFALSFLHFLHIISGIVVLVVLLINTEKGRYDAHRRGGFTAGSVYWHFLGFLWIYLLLFMKFS